MSGEPCMVGWKPLHCDMGINCQLIDVVNANNVAPRAILLKVIAAWLGILDLFDVECYAIILIMVCYNNKLPWDEHIHLYPNINSKPLFPIDKRIDKSYEISCLLLWIIYIYSLYPRCGVCFSKLVVHICILPSIIYQTCISVNSCAMAKTWPLDETFPILYRNNKLTT